MWRLSQRACEGPHIEDVDRLAKRAAIDRGEARRLESIPGAAPADSGKFTQRAGGERGWTSRGSCFV